MSDQKSNEQGKSCCSGGCCCSGKKFIIGLLLGVILSAASIGIFCASKCPMMSGGKMCPISGTPIPK